jgi:membrane protein
MMYFGTLRNSPSSTTISSLEKLMNDIESTPPGRTLSGWSLAAAAGLVAAAFFWDRISPPDSEAIPPKDDAGPNSSTLGRAAEGEDRGRGAKSPSEIPPKGWKDILFRVYRNIGDHRILALAAGMTYYSILAIFPALAALVAVYGLFSDPGSIAKHLDQISGFVPSGAIDVAHEQLTRVTSKGNQTLGFTFAIGLAVSLWTANAAMKSLFDTLNIVYGETDKRGFLKLNAVSLSFTVVAIGFVVAALAAVVVVPVVLNYLGLSHFADLVVRVSRWPAMFVVLSLALACVYRYGPSRAAPRWRWITWGSAAATIMWLVASGLFSWYATNFGKFNETYGSLGAVIGFMTWLWISAIVVLLGAELDAEMEHQTAHDTTTGAPTPLGTRGAKMADTVGAARNGA